MITSSIVLYKTKESDIHTIMDCTLKSSINKIYVVDNSPTDELKSIICRYDPSRVEYIFGQGNIGYGGGHNIALRTAIKEKAQYHVILNPDIYYETGLIEELAAYMDSHTDAGYIIPKVMSPDGSVGTVCRRLPTPFDIFAVRLLPKWLGKRQVSKYNLDKFNNGDVACDVPILSGCFMFMRVEVLEKSGLFDERFFMYFEDFDLMRRMHRIARNIYYPKVSLVHNHGNEHRKSKYMLKVSIKSAITYFNKWGWLFDRERWRVNRQVLDDSHIIKD